MILDLFAGPGGWDAGLLLYLGLDDVVGVEWDGAACETRDAAGLKTLRADVAALDPTDFLDDGIVGLIGSPPCQLFSTAGSKHGRGAIDLLADALRRIIAGEDPREDARREATEVVLAALKAEAVTAVDFQRADEKAPTMAANACLVLEPARFAVALRPTWIALEQVPAVLPLWQELAAGLRTLGYRTWAGVLNAADYGVPQTRRRAVLMAHRDQPVAAPEATHAERPEPSLFGPELASWVTMAEALGWGFAGPSPTVTAGGTGAGGGVEVFPNAATRGRLRVGFPRRDDGRPGSSSDDGFRERDWIDPEERPAQTVTKATRSILVNTGRDWKKGGTREDAQTFDATTGPAPAIDGKGRWHLIPGGLGYADANRRPYSLDEPAPTIAFGRDASSWRWARRNDQTGTDEVDRDWPLERPATTVATRDLIPDPGANANRFNGAEKSRNDGYRVEAAEAAVLQSFPPDYPFRGTRSKIFEQIGNAVPPRLAAHIIAALTERNRP